MDRSAGSFKGAVLNGNGQVVRRSSECRIRVKTGKAQCEQMFSALPPRADIARRSRHVRFVPSRDSCTAAKLQSYSITSSAVVRMSGGTVRASVLAVLRLMTSSYFVGA